VSPTEIEKPAITTVKLGYHSGTNEGESDEPYQMREEQ
jgi:hypothetical protein